MHYKFTSDHRGTCKMCDEDPPTLSLTPTLTPTLASAQPNTNPNPNPNPNPHPHPNPNQVGIKDPARPEVAGAIGRCRAAGIRVIMITGDSAPTASAISRDVSIFEESESLDGKVFVGGALAARSNLALA